MTIIIYVRNIGLPEYRVENAVIQGSCGSDYRVLFSGLQTPSLLRVLEDVAMQKPVQIDADLYARAAAAAAREGKHVETYINELIRLQIIEAERMHQLDRALDEIAIESDASGNAEGR